ncbi:hypothetical protein FIBSPDRAFT_927759 [Athelia psychrophila]|uniref:Uncharacterized protein n=1 Tax=Athelia psychrophila TaxID=1759441 RepID=A0A166RAL4_9AGAM|nr:hypothetical protein FIBSPDRAFT_927759 [Fibularhizoctonia sp. CBS 109695]
MSAPPTRPLLRLDPNLRRQCEDRTARKIAFQMMTTPAIEKSNISNMLRGFIAAERARTREGGTPLRIKVDLAYDLSSGLFRWMRTFKKAGQHTLPVEMWAEHEPIKEQGMRWRLMRSYCAAEAARAAANFIDRRQTQSARDVLASDDSDSSLSSILDDYYYETSTSSEIGTATPPSELAEDDPTAPVGDPHSEHDLSSFLEGYYCDLAAPVRDSESNAIAIILTAPSSPSLAHLAGAPAIQAEEHLQVPGPQLRKKRQARPRGHPSTSRGAPTQTWMQHSLPLFMARSYDVTEVNAESTTFWASAYKFLRGFCGFSAASQESQRKVGFYTNFVQQFEDERFTAPANDITEVTTSDIPSIWGLLRLCVQAPLRFVRRI